VELLEMGSEERVQGKSRKESREVKGHARRRRRTEMREAEDVDEGAVKGTGRSGEDNGGMGGRREKKEDEKEINSLKAEELTLHAAARRTAHREADKRTNFLLRASLSVLDRNDVATGARRTTSAPRRRHHANVRKPEHLNARGTNILGYGIEENGGGDGWRGKGKWGCWRWEARREFYRERV